MTSDQNAIVLATYAKDLIAEDLHSSIWNSSPPVYITRYWSGEPAPASRHAEVRVCWNENQLIVRFICEQQEPLIIADQPVTDRKTLGLWDRDVCEIFVAPDTSDPNVYFEFEAAPTGEWIDLGIKITPTARETEWDYSSAMTTTQQITTGKITIAIAIPWSERLPKPQTGSEWLVNLFRCVGPDEATRYLAWRPTFTPEPMFHVPAEFGVLKFQ